MRTEEKAPLRTALLTAVSVFVAMIVAFVGSGAIGGTPIQEAAGGWLNSDSTLLAPGTGAFSIWSVIYLGLVVYAMWQLTPKARASATQHRFRPLAAASAILNALWIVVVVFGWLSISVAVIVALLAVLAWMLVLMVKNPATGRTERWITGLVFGLYLGWVSVATVANIAALLGSLGVGDGAGWVEMLAAALVVVAALIGAATVWYSRGRISAAMAMTWGIAWIGIGRSDGGTTSQTVAATAFAAAGALLVFSLGAGILLRKKSKRMNGVGA